MNLPKMSRRQFVYLTSGVVAATALGACDSGSPKPTPGASAGTGPITFWSGYSTTDANDKAKKPADFWISKSIQRFTDKTGIQVKVDSLPGDATMFTKIRTASIGGKGPDVANVWSGSYMLSIADFLEPTRQYFDDAEYAGLSGWPAVTEGFDPSQSDKILGVPNGSDGAMVLLLNKKILADAGVDPTTWPVDFDTWLRDLDKIKATGITPLTLGKNSYLFFGYDTWLAQAVGGPAGIGALNSGGKNFSDPEVLDATTKWLKLRDYSVKGAATTDDGPASQQLFSGKAAMGIGGASIVAQLRAQLKDDAGVAKLPNISATGVQGGTIGGCGNAFIISKSSKHKTEAIAFIKHLLSADEQKLFAETGEQGPLVGRTDLKDAYTDPLVNQAQAWGVEESNTFWPDNTLSADLVNELASQAQLAWNGDIDAAEFLSRLDKKRDALK
jgi:raffinose/stachyose/melibiose transport system substrate-binding protein